MKKRLILIPALIGLLVSCSNPLVKEKPNNTDDPVIGDKTLIFFDNTQGNSTVSVFHDHLRRNEDKITEVPAKQLSEEIEWTPSASVPFYFSYLIKIKGIHNFSFYFIPEIGKDQTTVRVDENRKTKITVPKLEETLSSEDQLLSNDTYLLIQNNSSFSFQLQQGTSPIRPVNSSGSAVVNAGEKAQYKITPNSANYQLLVGADYKPVPPPDGGYKAGGFYSYIYNGSVVFDKEIKIILDNIDVTLSSFPPPNVSAAGISSTSIQINWDAVPEATGYQVYRSSDGSNYTLINVCTINTYTDTGLNPSTTYYYKVSTLGSNGESELSNQVSAATQEAASIPAPSGLSATPLNSSSIQVSWSNVTGATSYKVYRSNSATGSYNFNGNTYSSPYTDSGLSAGSTYYYKVSSVMNSQESAMSSSYTSATTQSGSGTIEYPPVMPTGLVVSSVYSGSITLTWNSVSTATSYNVYRSNALNASEAKLNTVTGTSYTDNVPAGAAYYYKVTGANSSGESPKSAGAFAYAESHYTLSYYANAQTLSLATDNKHYYRFAVTAGQSYTIEWHDGNNKNMSDTTRSFQVTAYQNNGTQIFSRGYYDGNGYSNPSVFTATTTGFVSIKIENTSGSSRNYQIYYY